MKKIISMLLVSVMALGLLAGCGSSNSSADKTKDNAEAETATEDKDTLRVALTSEPPSLTTCDHDSLISVGMNMLTYNGLMRIDNETLQPVPDLATEYSVENDVEWTFKLKEGVKFHDGSDFTAEDVVASLEYAKSIPSSVTYTNQLKSVEAVSDYEVKITTVEPYAGLLYDLGYHFNWILPSELIASGHDFNEEPIGTGPYKLKEWISGTSLTFEANDEYFDTERAAKIKNLVFTIIPEGVSRAIALEAGEVDFVWEIAGADAATLLENDDIVVEEVDSVDNVIFFLNVDKEPFNDPNLRNAIACAINREDIIAGALNGYGVVNYSAISQGYVESTDRGALEYNLDKAKEYLEAWGGDPSTVELPILVTNETRVAIATIIQSNLAQLGINVTVESMDTATYFDCWAIGDYTGLIASWSPSNALTYVQRYHSERRQQYPGAVNDPAIDALVAEAKSTLDDAERAEKIAEIVEAVNQCSPQISLYQSRWLRAHDADLKGVVLSATGYADYNMMYWE